MGNSSPYLNGENCTSPRKNPETTSLTLVDDALNYPLNGASLLDMLNVIWRQQTQRLSRASLSLARTPDPGRKSTTRLKVIVEESQAALYSCTIHLLQILCPLGKVGISTRSPTHPPSKTLHPHLIPPVKTSQSWITQS